MDASAPLRLAPAVRAAAPSARWRYVDEPRTHEVVLDWAEGDPPCLVVREQAPGEADPAARLVERTPLREPWAARLRHWELECQLALMGRYWRNRVGETGWSLVAPPAGAPVLDLRASEPLARADGSVVHHLHHRAGERDRILAALRLPAEPKERYQVVTAEVDVAAAEASGVVVLHARLPPGPSRSRLARGVMDFAARGFRPLVSGADYEGAHGPSGARETATLWDEVVLRIRSGRAGVEGRESGAEAATLAEFLHVLHDPRLVALHRRFLTQPDEDALVASNGPAIRRAVGQLRASVSHAQQHLVTILEASLLARERIRHKRFRCSDPEVAALRRLAFYL